MIELFYGSSVVAVAATILAITRSNAVHALLYLIISLLAVAGMMLALGAPLAAMLEIIVYAGAIMVLFVFVIMLLNLGPGAGAEEKPWLQLRYWIGPSGLSLALLIMLARLMLAEPVAELALAEVGPKQVGIELFGPYLLAVELASMLLLAGLVAAYHLGRETPRPAPVAQARVSAQPQIHDRSDS